MRAEQIENTRQDKILKVKSIIDAKNVYLSEHARAKTSVVQMNITVIIEKLNLQKFLSVEVDGRVLSLAVDEICRAISSEMQTSSMSV